MSEQINNIPILQVKSGKIFVEGVETTDAELIGMAFKDFAEGISKSGINFDSMPIQTASNYIKD